MKVFLDANILFSAAKSDGAVRKLLRLLVDRGDECWADEYVAAEARRNLIAKGPHSLEVLDALLTRLQLAPAAPGGISGSEVDWLPAKDRPVVPPATKLFYAASPS